MFRRASCASAFLLAVIGCDPEPAPIQPTPSQASAGQSAASGATQPAAVPSTKTTTMPARSVAPSTSSSAAPSKPARYAKLSDEEIASEVAPHLGKAKIAHPPYRGPFGPSQSSVVVITKDERGDFGGFVLVPRNGATKKLDLPVLQESWPGESVEAVGFVRECDGDAVEEMVVISKHRSASGTTTVTTAIDHDGDTFRRLPEVDMLAAKAKTVSDVRALLDSRTVVVRIDGVPVRLFPTVRPDAVAAQFSKLLGVTAQRPSETEVRFDYSEKKGRAPAQFIFSFNDSKVLDRIEMSATAKSAEGSGETGEGKEPSKGTEVSGVDPATLNPTGVKLAAWLTEHADKGTVQGTKTTWKHAGWSFTLDRGTRPEGAYHQMVLIPQR